MTSAKSHVARAHELASKLALAATLIAEEEGDLGPACAFLIAAQCMSTTDPLVARNALVGIIDTLLAKNLRLS